MKALIPYAGNDIGERHVKMQRRRTMSEPRASAETLASAFNAAIDRAVSILRQRADKYRYRGDPANGPGVIETELRDAASQIEREKRK